MARTTLHLLHGSEDRIFAADEQRRTLHQLDALGGDATLDIAEGIGHELHPALIDSALHRHLAHPAAHLARRARCGRRGRSSGHGASAAAAGATVVNLD